VRYFYNGLYLLELEVAYGSKVDHVSLLDSHDCCNPPFCKLIKPIEQHTLLLLSCIFLPRTSMRIEIYLSIFHVSFSSPSVEFITWDCFLPSKNPISSGLSKLNAEFTERRTSASHSGDPGFESRREDQLTSLKVYGVAFIYSPQIHL
jgi:hypothetical protein